jgi:predicted ester cyclase
MFSVRLGDVVENTTQVNRDFVRRHFEAINRREMEAVVGDINPDLIDHELLGDHLHDLQEGSERLKSVIAQIPDLSVEVRDILADNDKVVVRGVWSGTEKETQRHVEFHGFVQFRIAEGKIVERWATVTQLAEVSDHVSTW